SARPPPRLPSQRPISVAAMSRTRLTKKNWKKPVVVEIKYAHQRRSCLPATLDEAPHQQDEHCAHDCANETGFLTSSIPANGLSEIGGYQSAYNTKDRGENEALGLVVAAGRNEFGNNSSDKSDDHCPDKAQHISTPHDCCWLQTTACTF